MMPFQDERDSAEVRLMRSIVELNYRILRTPSPSERTALRTSRDGGSPRPDPKA